MSETRNVLTLVAVTAGVFMYIGHAVPQVKSQAAPEKVEIGDSPEELVAAGRTIFSSDRAQCLTCHSLGEDPKARCPNLEGVGERAATRKPGVDGPDYLVEALYDPNAFIVPGYPANQMNPVHKPPIALSHEEVRAVAAYLRSLGGTVDEAFLARVDELQDPWRKGLKTPSAGEVREAKLAILPGDAERGASLFNGRGICATCHKIGAEGKEIGPDLTAIGASQSPDYILESILDPNAVVVKGYEKVETPMPEDFAKILTPREVYDLVEYLLAQKGGEE